MSSLSGMTGFARVSGEAVGATWTWEARSVNGKTLDVRMRFPPEFSRLDAPVRKIFAGTFKRGNIQLSLTLQSSAGEASHTINEVLLTQLADMADARGEAIRFDQLLLVPGVVTPQTQGRSEGDQKQLEAKVLASAETLAKRLKSARDAEGTALAPLLSGDVDKIEALTAEAKAAAAVQTNALKEALAAKFSELLSQDLGEERLAQEAAVLAVKADVREELDRLEAHCEQARTHLAAGSPIGRKLDFLCQEFNRETNTLCSKSADIDLTRTGLELKSVIEQFREQVANVE